MAIAGSHAAGATPLTDDDVKGLRLAIATHAELNAVEAANIIHGQEWALRSKMTKIPTMLSHDYVRALHKKMYGEVWRWAGKYRKHDTVIGVPFQQIWHDDLSEGERHKSNAGRVGQILRDLGWRKGKRHGTRGQLYLRPMKG